MVSILGLVFALVLAGFVLWHAAPRETLQATVTDAHFVQERGPQGHTRIRLQAADGRAFAARRPGRHRWQAGDRVGIVVSGARVVRITGDARD